MNGRGLKKPPLMCSREFARMCRMFSKAALVDALWCACQLGTDESPEQITIKAARELEAALGSRGDRVPSSLSTLAALPIDSDPITDVKVEA